jgi:hypothetical protein
MVPPGVMIYGGKSIGFLQEKNRNSSLPAVDRPLQ